jgi:hypothetical protein
MGLIGRFRNDTHKQKVAIRDVTTTQGERIKNTKCRRRVHANTKQMGAGGSVKPSKRVSFADLCVFVAGDLGVEDVPEAESKLLLASMED